MTGCIATLSEHNLRGSTLTPRWGHCAACLGGKIYVFGGYLWFHGVEGFFSDFYEIDVASSQGRRVPIEVGPTPPARFGHSLVADEARNELIMFGGRNSTDSLNDVWIYQPSKGQWSQVFPTCRPSSSAHHSSSSRNGSVGNDGPSDEIVVTRKSEKRSGKRADRDGKVLGFETASHTGSLSPGLLASSSSSALMGGLLTPTSSGAAVSVTTHTCPEPRSWHSCISYKNCIYVYGGWNHNNQVFNDLWCYDLAMMHWVKLDPPDSMSKPPHGRSCHVAAVWGDCLYIYGGLREGDTAIGDMWKFNFESKIWAPVECLGSRPSGRTSSAAVIAGESWIIHGGLNEFPKAGVQALSEVIEFHFPTSTWSSRGVVLSDELGCHGRRYGHVAVLPLGMNNAILLGGAEKYATASQAAACRLDLLPSQAQTTEMQQDLFATSRVAQMNRERVTELVELVQVADAQIRQLKADNTSLADRCQTLQTQMAGLHQQQANLQVGLQVVQQALAAVDQFIPMMRSVGAAIANFGSAANAQSGWAAGSGGSLPGTNASLSRGMGTAAGLANSVLQSSGELP